MTAGGRALALVPLDARPCTLAFPAAIGRIGGCEVVLPPRDLLGGLDRPAAIAELFDWLEGVADSVDAAILGLDTLLYGGLVPARRSDDLVDTLLDRLARVRGLAIPDLYAFSVTLRISDSDVAEEEKPYWASSGRDLYRWSYHSDRFDVTRDPGAAEEARAARARIPDAVAEDYLATRRRNFAVNLAELELAEAGRFKILCLTQDDTSPHGFNQAEKRQLEARGVPGVLIYPGADEVAAALVGRFLNERDGRTPVFGLRVFPPAGAGVVAMYEDRPLLATAAGQILAAGGRQPREGEEPDLEVLLNAPATGQGDLALRLHLERVDSPPRDLGPLLTRLRDGPPAAFADVAYANGADPALWERLAPDFDPDRLAAFAGWNTAGNTLGTVVGAASAYLTGPRNPRARRAFLMDRLADDYLYQALLRPALRSEGLSADAAAPVLADRLAALWAERFGHLPVRGISASLPWGRLFEADITVW